VSAPSTDDLIIPADRDQQRFLIGVGAGFTAFGAAFLYYGTTEGGFAEVGWLALGAVSAGFFGLCTGLLLVRLLADRRPALVLSAEGLTDNSSSFPAGFIAWRDIEDVRANPRWVALQLRDESRMLARQPAWRRKLMRWNARRFGGDVLINTGGLLVQPEDLLRLINERLSGSGH
jgi:hypothetical protein